MNKLNRQRSFGPMVGRVRRQCLPVMAATPPHESRRALSELETFTPASPESAAVQEARVGEFPSPTPSSAPPVGPATPLLGENEEVAPRQLFAADHPSPVRRTGGSFPAAGRAPIRPCGLTTRLAPLPRPPAVFMTPSKIHEQHLAPVDPLQSAERPSRSRRLWSPPDRTASYSPGPPPGPSALEVRPLRPAIMKAASTEPARDRIVAVNTSTGSIAHKSTTRRSSSSSDRKEREQTQLGACAKLCCVLLCNIWLGLLMLCAFGPSIFFEGFFPSQELDYWYPAHLCPEHPEGNAPSFLRYRPLVGVSSSQACRAPTGRSSTEPCVVPFRTEFEGELHHTCVDLNSSSVVKDASYGLLNTPDANWWCPHEVDINSLPLGWPRAAEGGACQPACAQSNYVGTPSSPSIISATRCEEACAAGGSTAGLQKISISPDGWGGPSGFSFGSEYLLVAFFSGHYLRMDLSLHSASGRFLFRGTVAPHECTNQLPNVDDGEARRLLLQRRPNWFLDLFGLQQTGMRPREGDNSRWAGATPKRLSAQVTCAPSIVGPHTEVYLQSGCGAARGTARTGAPLHRLEIGGLFQLDRDDLPLTLSLHSINASMRGTPDLPELYFTAFTPSLNVLSRIALYVSVPFAYLFLSCLCCCCLACGCCCTTSSPQTLPSTGNRVADGPEAELGWRTPRFDAACSTGATKSYRMPSPLKAAGEKALRFTPSPLKAAGDQVVSVTREAVLPLAEAVTPLAQRVKRAAARELARVSTT